MSKFLFVVQGEGRGHLTQAISLSEILTSAGHEVVAVLVGKGNNQKLPSFFQELFKHLLRLFRSPSLVYGQGKALRVWDTISTHLLKFPLYCKSVKYLKEQIDYYQPDAVINFYEMICGLYFSTYRPNIPCICIAHQYLLLHEQFDNISKHWFDRFLLNFNTKVTALGSTQKLALSFDKMENDLNRNIAVVPPLLRTEVKKLNQQVNHLFWHTSHITNWRKTLPIGTKIIVMCKSIVLNNPDFSDEWAVRENLTFHQVNAEKFLTMMENCSGLVCTAGFESVCEAMYLGKPIMMVPVPNHIEQMINAHDGQRAGAGIASTEFDFSKFLAYLPQHQSIQNEFIDWQHQANRLFLHYLETLTQKPTQIFTFKPSGSRLGSWWRQLAFR
jgi:uncharacterized protein (TIGR00661 family)